MKKAIVFVDANNWYHNVKNLFDPGKIDIVKVANLLCAAKNYELVQIRWYASIPSIDDDEAVYYRHISFLEHLEKKGVKIITRKLQRLSNKETIEKKKHIIDNLDLCNHCRPIVESVFLDITDIKKKEKGIDVWAAIDIIKDSLMDNRCDVCILISGDADFIPSLELVRNRKKEILTAMVPFGYSAELRSKFPFFILRRETLVKCFRDYKDVKEDKKGTVH